MNPSREVFHGTTILLVKRGERTAIAGDGQVTLGDTVIKQTAKKIRRLHDDRILVGFAGATADAFALPALSPDSSESKGCFLLFLLV